MGKALLVTTNLPTTDKRYKRFVKLLGRKAEILELWPGAWFVKSEKRPHMVAERLSALFEDGDDHEGVEQFVVTFVVTTVGPDYEHINGWICTNGNDPWKWIREA